MATIERHIDVECPVRTVYNQWTQFEEFPRFMSGVVSVKQLSDQRLHWVIEIGDVKREFDAKITEQLPDNRVAWRSEDGPMHAGVVNFNRLSDSKTRVTVMMDYDPEGFLENVADKTGMIGMRLQGDLERFKGYIESRGRETGAWRGKIEQPGSSPGR